MFGKKEDIKMFNESYEAIKYYMRKGRKLCNSGVGLPPMYVNVNMLTGEVINNWIDSLQAAWPGVQVLIGDLEEAICSHAVYYALWQRFDALPERFNWNLQTPEVLFYPLRPELVESTYYLYQATKNPFYLHVGSEILQSLNNYSKVECGYATMHDVTMKDNEDRMESFFLGETCKYLYLLFDVNNHVNKESSRYLFSTEGHLFPILPEFRRESWRLDVEEGISRKKKPTSRKTAVPASTSQPKVIVESHFSNASINCEKVPYQRRFELPLRSQYLQQVRQFVGLF